MKLTNLTPEDPKLTAYALGELDAEESAQLATLIKNDPVAQATVQEIRSLAGQLEEVLEHEPVISASPVVPATAPFEAQTSGTVFRLPLYWVTGLAAACFLLVLASQRDPASSQPPGASDVASVQSGESTKSPSAAHSPIDAKLPVVEMRKRAVPLGTDVRPAPLREDRIRFGSTVADTGKPSSDLASPTKTNPLDSSAISAPQSDGIAYQATPRRGETIEGTPETSVHSSEGQIFATIGKDRRSLLPTSDSLVRRNRDYSPSLNYGNTIPDPSSTLNRKREAYAYQPAQGFLGVAGYPLSSFSATVETGSYANVRSSLESGLLPAPDAVRVEEMLNYFSYGYSGPRDGNALAASLEVAAAPWNPAHRLVRIGLKGRDLPMENGEATMVAKDVRLEVEFNPEQAKSYRLIGYENRTPIKTNNPTKIPGAEVEAGDAVTALYEVVPIGTPEPSSLDGTPLRYDGLDAKRLAMDDPRHRELLTLKIRYQLPTVDVNRKMELPLIDTGADFAVASKDFKFAAAVAGFGMLLKESPHKGTATYDKIMLWAQEGQDNQEDPAGRRHEFIDLVKKAKDATVE